MVAFRHLSCATQLVQKSLFARLQHRDPDNGLDPKTGLVGVDIGGDGEHHTNLLQPLQALGGGRDRQLGRGGP